MGDSGPGTHVCLRRDTTFEHLTRCLLSSNLTYLPHKSTKTESKIIDLLTHSPVISASCISHCMCMTCTLHLQQKKSLPITPYL